MDFWYFLMVLQIACFVTSATSVPIAMPMVDDVQDQDQIFPSTGVHERGAAPQVISPILMPSVAPVVSAPPSGGDTQPETDKSQGNETSSTSSSVGEAKTNPSPSTTEACKPSAPSGPSSDDQWIKIMGILVPAIVAIGLGIGGFCVTIHVNGDKRADRRANRDDECN